MSGIKENNEESMVKIEKISLRSVSSSSNGLRSGLSTKSETTWESPNNFNFKRGRKAKLAHESRKIASSDQDNILPRLTRISRSRLPSECKLFIA
jgi:hypothetical protein